MNDHELNSNLTLSNTEILEREFKWLERVIKDRIEGKEPENELLVVEPDASPYLQMVREFNFGPDERLLLLLVLAPDFKPGLLDGLFVNAPDKPEVALWKHIYGGYVQGSANCFVPTIKTACFVLNGDSFAGRHVVEDYIQPSNVLQKQELLDVSPRTPEQTSFSRTLLLGARLIDAVLVGTERPPEYSPNFPANLLTTSLEWEELILSKRTHEKLTELLDWLQHAETLLKDWKLERRLGSGYRCLFTGSPGTGKTLAVALLGKYAKRPVYRIDLSRLISKYIGETEKNLENIFNQAEGKNWILFFDEADALFAKRTHVASSNDRYANQETAYLLQKIEECTNPILMATNLYRNLDAAFARRFQSIIQFPEPEPNERLQLWKQNFSQVSTLDDEIDLEEAARKYKLTGGGIINVVRYVSLRAIANNRTMIIQNDLVDGVRKEYAKDGRQL